MKHGLGRRISLVLAVSVMIAACGGDDAEDADATDDAAATTAVDGGETAGDGGISQDQASSDQLETWQTDLTAVGCWTGPADGTLGPQTEAAIRAFQAASGLEVDGLLGPLTEGALQDAVAAGETVCTDSGDGEEAASGGTAATLASPGYGPVDFTIGSCTSAGESDIQLQAQVDNMTLTADASALAVDGGTEGDGITLNGTVESVSVGDAGDFTVTGTFGAPNLGGEQFTLTGSCA